MRFTGSGHPAIRATHAKTLEVTSAAEITERATCVVAVAAAAEPPQPVAGPVRVTLRAGGETFEFRALGNPSWDPRGPAVIRRSPLRLPGTLATSADAGASDLPAGLRAALRDPAASVLLELTPEPSGPTVVLFAADGTHADDPRLAAELVAADTVLVEDAGARALVAGKQADGQRTVSRLPDRLDGRLLVVSTQQLPGRSLPPAGGSAAVPADAVFDVVGLPPLLAAGAAAMGDAPLVVADPQAPARRVLLDTPANARLLLGVELRKLPELLREAGRLRATRIAVLVRDTAPPVRVTLAEDPESTTPALPGSGPVFVCLPPTAVDTGATGARTGAHLDARARLAVEGLLADDVPPTVAARALAQLTGWSRREAYAAVLVVQNRLAGR